MTLLGLEAGVVGRPSPLLSRVLPGEWKEAQDLLPSVGVPAHSALGS